MKRLVLEETCEHETFDLEHYVDCEWFSPQRTILQPAEILAAANLAGAEVREAVPVLPGGPPRWLDAKGPGHYLVIPLSDKETPNE